MQQQQTSREFPPADDHGRCGGDLICVLISLLAPINGLYHPVHSSNEAEIQIASGRDWIGLDGMGWVGFDTYQRNAAAISILLWSVFSIGKFSLITEAKVELVLLLVLPLSGSFSAVDPNLDWMVPCSSSFIYQSCGVLNCLISRFWLSRAELLSS